LLAEMLLIVLPSTLRWPEHVFPLNLSELVSVLATFVPHLHRHIPSAYRPFPKQREIESPVSVYAGLSSSRLSLHNQSNRLKLIVRNHDGQYFFHLKHVGHFHLLVYLLERKSQPT